jgi:hypothetical protein
MLVVYVEKWGFKEGAMSFREPQVAMSVRDQDGESVETVQVGLTDVVITVSKAKLRMKTRR